MRFIERLADALKPFGSFGGEDGGGGGVEDGVGVADAEGGEGGEAEIEGAVFGGTEGIVADDGGPDAGAIFGDTAHEMAGGIDVGEDGHVAAFGLGDSGGDAMKALADIALEDESRGGAEVDGFL